MLRDTGMKAEEFADKEKGKRFAEWLKENPELTEEEEFRMRRDAGIMAEQFAGTEEGKRYAAWLEKNPETSKVKATKPRRKKKQDK